MSKQEVFKGSVIAGLVFMVLMAAGLIVWRRMLWGDVYLEEGFFGFTEPSRFLLVVGLGTYFLVGALFAMLYGHIRAVAGQVSTLRIAAMFAMIYWVCANLGYIGRVPMENPGLFLVLEGVSDVVVFALFAPVLKAVFSPQPVDALSDA